MFKKFLCTTLACAIGVVGSSLVDNVEAYNGKTLRYQARMSNNQLTNTIFEPEKAGTVALGRALWTLAITADNLAQGEEIQYCARVNGQWLPYVSNGTNTGVSGTAMTGLRIRLANMNDWTVYYRVHVANEGWKAWVADNQIAGGTTNTNQIEAVQIFLIRKPDPRGSRTMQLYHDQSAAAHGPEFDDFYNMYYVAAMAGINTAAQVFITPTNPSILTPLLDGSTCGQPSVVCHCSFADQCGVNHHKNSNLQLFKLAAALQHPSVYRLGLVNHVLCDWTGSSHINTTVGRGFTPPFNPQHKGISAVTRFNNSSWLLRTIQHEVAHNTGALDHTCNPSTAPCVMKENVQNATAHAFCAKHLNEILTARNNNLL